MADPMNIAGKIGPPRNPDSDTAYAIVLASTSTISAPTVHAEALSTRPGSASWPENRTFSGPLPVSSPKAMAAAAMTRPATGVQMSRLRRTIDWRASPATRMALPRNVHTTAMAIAHKNRTPVGWVKTGSPGIDRENVPSPVRSLSPTKIRVPIPAASSPGTSTSPSMAPPIPEASIKRNAPTRGDPSRVLTAAKLPAAAIIVAACGGASLAARCTASTPSPPPMAISGASGPSTTPSTKVASDARNTPGRSIGRGGVPVVNPSAGSCPDVPGK